VDLLGGKHLGQKGSDTRRRDLEAGVNVGINQEFAAQLVERGDHLANLAWIADAPVDLRVDERERCVGSRHSSRSQSLIEFIQGHVDRQVNAGARFELAFEHIAVEINNARDNGKTTPIHNRRSSGGQRRMLANRNNPPARQPQRPVLQRLVG
jgi:hypothetical protein